MSFGAAADWAGRTGSILKAEEKKPVRSLSLSYLGHLGLKCVRELCESISSGYEASEE